jgi:hypothetical protein
MPSHQFNHVAFEHHSKSILRENEIQFSGQKQFAKSLFPLNLLFFLSHPQIKERSKDLYYQRF